MTHSARPTPFHLPPHLTMDEYVTWIQASLEQLDPVKAARQKAIQEQITTPFRLKEPSSPSANPASSLVPHCRGKAFV